MSVGVLPEDGEDLTFTSIGLSGPGRRHRSQGGPVTWITDWTQTSAGTHWAELSEKAAETGLRPFLLADMPGEPGRPWGTPESDGDEVISTPLDTTAIDRLDATQVLGGWWWGPSEEELAEDAANHASSSLRAPLAFSTRPPSFPATDVGCRN